MSTDYFFICKPCKVAIDVASWGFGGFQFYRGEPECMKALHKFLEDHTVGVHEVRLETEHVVWDDDDFKIIEWRHQRDAASGESSKEKS